MRKIAFLTLAVVALLVVPALYNPGTQKAIATTLPTPTNSAFSNNNNFKPLQTGAYGTIDVYPVHNETTGNQVPSDWYNTNWKYRVKVTVTENSGINRDAVPITVHLSFQPEQARVGTIMVLDNSSGKELPYQLWNVTYYNASFYKSLYVTWIGTLSAHETKIYYVYWSDINVTTSATLINDKNHSLVVNSGSWGYEVQNKFYDVKLLIGGGIDVRVNGQQLFNRGYLTTQPYYTVPSNVTYVWLDSTTMYSGYSGSRDHIKIIPWYDNTRIIVYGYNGSTGTWEKALDVVADTNGMIRFPTVGESPYNLTKIEASKTVTILVGDIGSVYSNSYGADHTSDDDFYSYFGTELITWVPRDMFISAYYNNTHVKVIDLSDGDDTFDLTLNFGDVWFHGAGDTRTTTSYYYYDTTETPGSPSFFENDIVKIIADKPVTIIAGLIADNTLGIIKGLDNKKFVFPYLNKFTIAALEDNTEFNVTLKVYNFTTGSFDTFYTDSGTLNAYQTKVYKEDPAEYPLVVAVDLYKNASSNPVDFNVTIFRYMYNFTSRSYYWEKYYTYLGTVTPEGTPGVTHRNDPNVGNWNETTLMLPGGYYYMVSLYWNGTDNLWLYLYWKGQNPLYDGDGDDYITVRGSSSLPSGADGQDHRWYWYVATPVCTGGYAYTYELRHEEWGIAIVESNKPIVITTIQTNYAQDVSNGLSGYGSEYFFGKEINLVVPDSNRYLRLAAVLPNTHVRVFFNGTNTGWPDATYNDYGQVSTKVIYYGANNSEIVFYNTSSWINIPAPRNTFVRIVADKPITVKFSYAWSGTFSWNYVSGSNVYSRPYTDHYVARFGIEEISLFILDVPQYTINVSSVVTGPLYTKLNVRYDIRSSIVVMDTIEFWANVSYFKVSRKIFTPQYVSYEDEFSFLSGFFVSDLQVESIEMREAPYTSVSDSAGILGGIFGNLTDGAVLTFSGSTFGLGIGLLDMSALGSSVLYGAYYIAQYDPYMEALSFNLWAGKKLYLAGSESNAFVFSFIVTAGSFSGTISTETVNNLLYEENKATVVKADVESTYIDITVRVYDYDLNPMLDVNVTLHSDAMGYDKTLTTDRTGTVVFSKVPAYDDYTLRIYWTNTSAMYEEFPVADRTFGAINIQGDSLYEYKIKVRTMAFNIMNVDNEPFDKATVHVLGIYHYYEGPYERTEIVVNTTDYYTDTSRLVLSWMPLGRTDTSYDFMEYRFNFTYSSVYGIEVVNSTSFTWETSNTTYTFNITMSLTTLYVRVLDSTGNNTLPGATVVLYYDARNYTGTANLSGIATFTYIPTGTYDVNGIFYGKMASSNTSVTLANRTIVNITLPVTYGEKPTEIALSSEYIEEYWGTQVTISAQLINTEDGVPIEGNMTVFIIDRFNNIIIQSQMAYTNATGSPVYTYTFLLDSKFRAGDRYIIQVSGFAENYAKPSPQNATLYVKPIKMVVNYHSRINVYWGRTATIIVNVTHTIEFNEQPISGAEVSATITRNFITIESLTLSEDPANSGSYKATVNIDAKYSIGFYTVTVTISKLGYENATVSILLNVMRAPTIAVPNTTSITVIYGQPVKLKVTYNRTDYTVEGVTGANATYRILDTSYNQISPATGYYTLTDLGNGEYTLNFNSSMLDIGIYIVRVELSTNYHEAKSVDVTLRILEIPTTAIASKLIDTVEWGQNLTVTIQYNRTIGLTTMGIKADTATYEVKLNQTTELSGNLTYQGNGVYLLNFNTTLIHDGVGTYVVYVNLEKQYHQAQTIIIQLTVTRVHVNAYAQPANMTVTWGETGQSTITYNRQRDNEPMQADAVLTTLTDITHSKEINTDAITITYTNEKYIVTIDTTKLNSSTLYKLTINFIKDKYEPVSIEIYISVNPRAFNVALLPDSAEAVWGDKANYTLMIQDRSTGEGITDANLQFTGDEEVLNAITYTHDENGTYHITIDTTKINKTQRFLVTVAISKTHYSTVERHFYLTVNPVEIEVTITGQENVQLNPITAGMTSYEAGVFDKSRGGIPVTQADVYLQIQKGGKTIYEAKMSPISNRPGYYMATVDWTNIPGFTPGETYGVTVSIKSLSINGVAIPVNKVDTSVTGTTSTAVDYLGGHTELPGMGRVPALIAYPVIAVILIVGSIVAYKVIMYMRLPEEVKEIDKLIKLIEKGELEYEAPSREDVVRSLLEEELGTK